METERIVAQRIETISDIETLLGWIADNTQKPNIRFYSAVFHSLYSDGKFSAVHVDTLIRIVAKKNLWSGDLNQKKDTELSLLRDRFARRIRWLNKKFAQEGSPYADTLIIIYDRTNSRYQMVTAPESVMEYRNPGPERKRPEVAVEFHEEELLQGLPLLCAGNELEFSLRSSISGFVYIFHRDADGHVDRLFPEPKSELSFEATKGKEIFFPDAISNLCKLKHWRIGAVGMKEPVRQQLFVVVTAKNIDISVQDAVELLGQVQGRPIFSEHTDLNDLNAKEKLFSTSEYWLKAALNAPS